MNNNLRVDFLGFNLENPCLLASASPTQDIEQIEKAFKLGWAGAVVKTIAPEHIEVEDVSNRFHALKLKNKSYAFENIEQLSKKSLDYWVDGINRLKSKYPEKMVIASIMADLDKNAWTGMILKLEKCDADAYELNFSCPHMRVEDGMGASIGQNPTIAAEITSWVKEVTNKPVIVKLTPNIASPEEIVKKCDNAGADSFAAINTVLALIGVDIETFDPLPNVGGFSSYGGLSGAAVKPIGLRFVSQIAKTTNKPIMGIGGIEDWKDVLEYMCVGSGAVQICTAVMMNGFVIIKDILAGLELYMNRKGLKGLSEIVGVTVKRLVEQEELSRTWSRKSHLEEEKCIKCKKCITACEESGNNAIGFTDNYISINKEKCDGCALCVNVCPTLALSL